MRTWYIRYILTGYTEYPNRISGISYQDIRYIPYYVESPEIRTQLTSFRYLGTVFANLIGYPVCESGTSYPDIKFNLKPFLFLCRDADMVYPVC